MASDSDQRTAREIIYVGDPMCSWCWGIAPELDAIRDRRSDLDFRIVLGGLRPGPAAEPVTDSTARTLAHHWEQVAERSGQPFDHSILERRDWTYDTEPASKAVVVMRELDETLAWPMFHRLQQAFYAEGRIIVDEAVIAELVAELLFRSPPARRHRGEDCSGVRLLRLADR
jgi:putative protein-disulfide isomerase